MFFLNLLLAQMPSTEKIEKESPDEPDSDSEDELTEEENQRDTSSTEMQEESQSSGAVGRLRPKPAYLSSNPKSQSRLAVTSNSCSQRQKIRYSRGEKSIFYNILMVSSGTRLPPCISTAFVPQFFFHLCLTQRPLGQDEALRLVSAWLITNRRFYFLPSLFVMTPVVDEVKVTQNCAE